MCLLYSIIIIIIIIILFILKGMRSNSRQYVHWFKGAYTRAKQPLRLSCFPLGIVVAFSCKISLLPFLPPYVAKSTRVHQKHRDPLSNARSYVKVVITNGSSATTLFLKCCACARKFSCLENTLLYSSLSFYTRT